MRLTRTATALTLSSVLACGEPAAPDVRDDVAVAAEIGVQVETWTYDLLGNIGGVGAAYFTTSAINDSGHVVGVARHPLGPIVGWRWRGGVFSTTAPLDSTWGGAYGLNDRGDVFGKRSTDLVKWTAMLWHFGGLGSVESSYRTRTPGADVEGRDINNSGYAVGWECVVTPFGSCPTLAILWTPTSPVYPWWPTPSALGPLGTEDRAFAINNLGTALGHTRLAGRDRAWLNSLGGRMQALPLGSRYSDSWPGGINDVGNVVGVAHDSTLDRMRFVTWKGMAQPVDPGIPVDALPYQNQLADVRISMLGRIAGNAAGNVPFTFRNGAYTALPLPAGTFAEASDVNTCGVIVGTAVRPGQARQLIRWRRLQHGQPVCD